MPKTLITETRAREVAAQWMGPGRIGNVLASLATGVPCDRNRLGDDVEATMREAGMTLAEYRASGLADVADWAANAESPLLGVALVCSECGTGHYASRSYACADCGHVISDVDIRPNLEPGERVVFGNGGLLVTYASHLDTDRNRD